MTALARGIEIKHSIVDLIDIEKIHSLLENLSAITGISSAVSDLDGKSLSATGWTEICTKFHRLNFRTAQRCKESDELNSRKVMDGNNYIYQCPNGLMEVAIPIIVAGSHVGNFFMGQFFFEQPEEEFFRKQASEYGFTETSYLEALAKVPIFSRQQVEKISRFAINLTEFLGETGLNRLKQTAAAAALLTAKTKYETLISSMAAAFALHEIICDEDGNPIDYRFLEVNQAFRQMINLTEAEIIGKTARQLFPKTAEIWIEKFGQVALTGKPIRFDNFSIELNQYFEAIVYSPQKGQFAGVFTDISARKQVENELKKHQESLEELVEKRTAELKRVINLMAGREMRMAELKENNKKLQGQLNKPK